MAVESASHRASVRCRHCRSRSAFTLQIPQQGSLVALVLSPALRKHPVDGFSAGLVDDENVYEWDVSDECRSITISNTDHTLHNPQITIFG